MKHRLLYNQRSRPLVVRREVKGQNTLIMMFGFIVYLAEYFHFFKNDYLWFSVISSVLCLPRPLQLRHRDDVLRVIDICVLKFLSRIKRTHLIFKCPTTPSNSAERVWLLDRCMWRHKNASWHFLWCVCFLSVGSGNVSQHLCDSCSFQNNQTPLRK